MEFYRRDKLQRIGDGAGKTINIDSHSIEKEEGEGMPPFALS